MKKEYLKIIVCCIGFFVSLCFFNGVCDIYNMSTLHRVFCIFSISFTHCFNIPLFNLFENNFRK